MLYDEIDILEPTEEPAAKKAKPVNDKPEKTKTRTSPRKPVKLEVIENDGKHSLCLVDISFDLSALIDQYLKFRIRRARHGQAGEDS